VRTKVKNQVWHGKAEQNERESIPLAQGLYDAIPPQGHHALLYRAFGVEEHASDGFRLANPAAFIATA
jgi:hypothetical protein